MAPMVPGEPQMIPMDVPSVNAPHPYSFGEAGRSFAEMGSVVENFGSGLLQQLKQSEAMDSSDKALFQDTVDSEDKMQQLKIKYKTGFVTDDQGNKVKNTDGSDRTITQEFRDWANDRYQQNQNNLPSFIAQKLYTEKAGRYFTGAMLKVRDDELQQRTSNFQDGFTDRRTMAQNRMVDMPDPNTAYQYTDNLISSAKDQVGHILSPDQFHALSDQTQKQNADALFRGLMNNAIREPKHGSSRTAQIDYALSVLNGQDPDSQRRKQNGLYTFSDTMSPDQKAEFEKHFLTLKQQATQLDIGSLNQQTKDATALIDMGKPVDISRIVQGWNQVRAAKKMDDYEYADKVGGLYAHAAAQQSFNTPAFLLASPADKQKFIESAGEKAFQQYIGQLPPDLASKYGAVGGSYRKEFSDELSKLGNQADQRATNDFAQFANFSPEVRAASSALQLDQPQTLWKTGAFLKQRNDAISNLGDSYFKAKSPDFRLITKKESGDLSDFLKNPTTAPAQVVNGLEALRGADPDRYGSTIDQMIRDKNLDESWRFVLGAPDTQTRVDIVSSIRDGKVVREEAGKILKDNNKTWEQLDKAVGDKAKDFLTADFQGIQDSSIALKQIEAVRSAITTKAAKLYAADHGSNGDLGTYAQQAVDALYGSQYKSVNTGGGGLFLFSPGSQNQINIPRYIDNRPVTDQETENFVKNRSALLNSNDSLKAAGISLPKGMDGIDPNKFYDQLRTTAKIVPSGDRQGFYLQYKDPTSNSWVNALTEQKDRNGNQAPFYVKLKDLIQDPPKPAKSGSSFVDQLLNMGMSLKKSF